MADNYFEGAKITVDAKLKSFLKPYSGPVEVKFIRNGAEELHKTTVNATKGKFDNPLEYIAAGVAKTETNYDLSIVCSYKGTKKKLLKAVIWPKKVKLFLNDQDGVKLGHWDFVIRQKEVDDQDLATDPDAKAEVQLRARAPYSVAVQPPYSILEDKQAKDGEFRNHIIKIKRNIKAKFVHPDVTKDPYKTDPDNAPAVMQWVNRTSLNPADAATHGCDSFGSRIVFTVCADPMDEGRRGDKIYFEVKFGAESKRNSPAREVLTSPPVHNLKKSDSDRKFTGHVLLGAEGGTVDFQVELGIAGGDTCEVKIGGTADVADAKLKLINWRKMFAQITKLNTATKVDLSAGTGGLKPVFIDFVEDKVVDVAEADAPAGAIFAGTVLVSGGKPKVLVIGDHNVDPLKAKMDGKYKTDKLACTHLILCDYQYDAEDLVHSVTLPLAPGATIEFPPSGGSDVAGIEEPASKAGRKACFLSIDIRDGSDPLKKCKWKSTGKSGDIPRDHVLIDKVKYGNSVFIKMPDEAKAELDAGKTLDITLKVAYADGPFNGWCTDPDKHNVIALGRTDKRICGTIVHECGHAIQQAAETAAEFPGLPAPPHDRHYINRGHSGPHCAEPLDNATYTAGGDMNSTTAAKCTCIMYGNTGSRTTDSTEFCAKCKPYVKAVSVEKVSTT